MITPERNRFLCGLTAVAAALLLFIGWPVDAQQSATTFPAAFPVLPHNNVTIEWWYLNAHVTTSRGRHLAVIGCFFRFGNAHALAGQHPSAQPAARQSHYLIYAITDEDAQTHKAYSMADDNTLKLMQQAATLEVMAHPGNSEAENLLAMASKGDFPPPTKLIAGACHVDPSPFAAVYGSAGSVRAVPGKLNTFRLALGGPGSGLHLDLTFSSTKPPMYVGGDGNTGIVRPDDMKYVSLTRCNVSGAVDGVDGLETVTSGQGWFDHQWGDSWTTEAVGWDWFGIQLDDGRDILIFQQRHLKTGDTFEPMATIEDKTGRLTVTKNIRFTPDLSSIWQSPATQIKYPLGWSIYLPDANLHLVVTPDIVDQEIPVLANGGAIWEGAVHVLAAPLPILLNGQAAAADQMPNLPVPGVSGVGYMELVGYASPAVQGKLDATAK